MAYYKKFIFCILIIICFFLIRNSYGEDSPLSPPPKISMAKFKRMLGDDFQRQFFAETGHYNELTVLNKTWGVTAECLNVEAVSLSLLETLKFPYLTDINKVLTEVGLGLAVVQFTIDLATGNQYIGSLNFVKSYALYKLSKSSIKVLSAASLAISFVDYALTQFGATAIDIRYKRWQEAYNAFYSDLSNPYVRSTYEEWKEIFQTVEDVDDIEKMLAFVDDYLDDFWTADPLRQGQYFTSERSFFQAEPTAKEKKEIEKEYLVMFFPTIRTYLYRFAKERAQKDYEQKMERFYRILSEWYSLTFNLEGPEALIKYVPVKFGFLKAVTDERGEAVFQFNLYHYLKAGCPQEIMIYLGEEKKLFKTKIKQFGQNRRMYAGLNFFTKIEADVLDKDTERPIAKAELFLKQKKGVVAIKESAKLYGQTIESSYDGHLFLEYIPVGKYTIMLNAPGYSEKKWEDIKFYHIRRKPFYLEKKQFPGIHIKADSVHITPSSAEDYYYRGVIDVVIDVENNKAKVYLDLIHETPKFKSYRKVDGVFDLRILYKKPDGRIEFDTKSFQEKHLISEYKPETGTWHTRDPGYLPHLRRAAIGGIIDLQNKTVAGKLYHSDFQGTCSIRSMLRGKSEQEIIKEIYEIIERRQRNIF